MLMTILLAISIAILFVALTLCGLKVFFDRDVFAKLVALDVIANIIIMGIALIALIRDQPYYLNVTLAIALIMFLGNIAYATFLYARKVQ